MGMRNVIIAWLQVKVGVTGAEECGEMEEWFNYRMSRAASSVCADFLGSFTADITKGQFTQGGKWLIWKYEVYAYPSFDLILLRISFLLGSLFLF